MGRAADLTRAKIAGEALALLDAEGTVGLTMRGIANRLGVRAPSIYYHFSGQDELVDAVHDLVDEEIDLTGLDDGDWRAGLGAVARSYQAAYARHPHAVALVGRRRIVSPRALTYYDRMIARLTELGVPDARVLPTLGVLDYIALGSAGETFIGGFHRSSEQYRPNYPHLAASLAHLDREAERSESDRSDVDRRAFEIALESWLDHVDLLRTGE